MGFNKAKNESHKTKLSSQQHIVFFYVLKPKVRKALHYATCIKDLQAYLSFCEGIHFLRKQMLCKDTGSIMMQRARKIKRKSLEKETYHLTLSAKEVHFSSKRTCFRALLGPCQGKITHKFELVKWNFQNYFADCKNQPAHSASLTGNDKH